MAEILLDTLGRQYRIQSNSERFWSKVNRGLPSECWEWRRHQSKDGYGLFDKWIGKDTYTSVVASRFAYGDIYGEIPTGLQIDHLCRNRLCCNPNHLELVTQQENIKRGEVGLYQRLRAINRTQCRNGHLITEDTSYIRPEGYRECRECRRIGLRKWYLKRRGNNGKSV